MKKSVGSILFVFVSCIFFLFFRTLVHWRIWTNCTWLWLKLKRAPFQYPLLWSRNQQFKRLRELQYWIRQSPKSHYIIYWSSWLKRGTEKPAILLLSTCWGTCSYTCMHRTPSIFSYINYNRPIHLLIKGKNRISTSSIKAIPKVAKFGRATVISSFVFNNDFQIWQLYWFYGVPSSHVNPLSPKIHIQIYSQDWCPYISFKKSWENLV